jgi:Ca2+-binding RTX toxin-like protein
VDEGSTYRVVENGVVSRFSKASIFAGLVSGDLHAGDDFFDNQTSLRAIIQGGDNNDVLKGGSAGDYLFGDTGEDLIDGRAGGDVLVGGDGADYLEGRRGDDVLNGEDGDDRLSGGIGNDTIRGGDGIDYLWGDDDDDLLDGGAKNDVLSGGRGNDSLEGRRGNDELYGGIGDDSLSGGMGDDSIFGESGRDLLFGDDDNDLIYGGDDPDVVHGNSGTDSLDGGAGDDRIYGDDGNDSLEGRLGQDRLEGGLGADTLSGGLDNDLLMGDGGIDVFYGDDGNDILWRDGQAEEQLVGGAGFDFEIYTNGFTSQQSEVLIQAARRWGTILVDDLPNVPTLPGRFIDDLSIIADVQAIDGQGGTLAHARVLGKRGGSLLPYAGTMTLDSAGGNSSRLLGICIHEIGHILGIGSLWEDKQLLFYLNADNPVFIGDRATAEYNSLFNTFAFGVPVENVGGAGSVGGHWRESVLGTELMTSVVGDVNPISRITIASLADLGYVVNMNAADAFEPIQLPTTGLITAKAEGADAVLVKLTSPPTAASASLATATDAPATRSSAQIADAVFADGDFSRLFGAGDDLAVVRKYRPPRRR